MTRYERELVNCLTAAGWSVIRAPSSGSATDRHLPDLLALSDEVAHHVAGSRRTFALAIEHKTTSSTTAYAEEAEVRQLCLFAETAGAHPLIAGRFKRSDPTADRLHYLVAPQQCRLTDAGSFGVPLDDAADRAAVIANATTDTVDASELFADPQPST